MRIRYLACFTADLQNFTHLQPEGGWDNQDLHFYLALKCINCAYPADVEQVITASANIYYQCPECQEMGTVRMVRGIRELILSVRIVEGIGEPLSLAASELGYSAPAMFFIAEDLEILDCDVDTLWTGRAVGFNETYHEIDLSVGPFNVYNEEMDIHVSVSNLKIEIVECVLGLGG